MLHRFHDRAQPSDAPAVLDGERLDAYVVALAFQRLAGQLVPALLAAFRDQLDRASLSILLNQAMMRRKQVTSSSGTGTATGG